MSVWILFNTMLKPAVESPALLRRRYQFGGKVQGVGFRYTARNIAMRHNVTGYVKNLCDGKVELVLEGPVDEVQNVIEAVKERMGDYIRRVEELDMPATGEFAYFSIRHC